MRTHIVEVTNGAQNWGKFLIGQFDHEWARTSEVDTGRPLLSAIGWGPQSNHALVLDLQTGEGAMFRLGGMARADLEKHKVWVCPMFEPFLEWLYAHVRDHASWWDTLPTYVDLPDAPFALHGYRRAGAS